jgi:hypothetical protein
MSCNRRPNSARPSPTSFATYSRSARPRAERPASPLGAYEHFLDRTAEGLGDQFTDIERPTFPWSRTYTRNEWLDQLRTSGIAQPLAKAGKLEAVLEGTATALDAAGGSFTLESTAVALLARRV